MWGSLTLRNDFCLPLIPPGPTPLKKSWRYHEYTRLPRCSKSRGSGAGFSQVSPTKFEAAKSFLFTESSLLMKIKSTWLIFFHQFVTLITFFGLKKLKIWWKKTKIFTIFQNHLNKTALGCLEGFCREQTEDTIFVVYKLLALFRWTMKNMGLCLNIKAPAD